MKLFIFRKILSLGIYSLIFLTGCGSPNSNPVSSNLSNQSCTINIPSAASLYLCDVYHKNLSSQCDAQIRKELINRNQILYPLEQCGKSSKDTLKVDGATASQNYQSQICTSDFSGSTAEYLCETYHKNRWVQCDSKIRNEIINRGLKLNPVIQCGQKLDRDTGNSSLTKSSPQCDVVRFTTEKLCDDYWNNRNSLCNSNIISEINKRGWSHQPQLTCGTMPFTSNAGGNTAKQEFKFPQKVIAGCDMVMGKIKINLNPIATACILHHRSMEVDSIKCKGNIDEFIKLNSKGVGKSFATCGLQE